MFLPVLAYHKIGDEFDLGINHVSPGTFEKQIEFLSSNGYVSLTVSQITAHPHDLVDGKFVVITFDDAYCSVFDRAFPVLLKNKFTATVFVITDFIGKHNSWDYGSKRIVTEHCSWEQLKKLRDAGWEIGSHTRTHPHLPFLNARDLTFELEGSRSELEDGLHEPINSIAYPYGLYNEQVIASTRACGYRFGCSMANGSKDYKNQPLQMFRRGVYRYEPMTLFKAKLRNSTLSTLNDLIQKTISACSQSTILRYYLTHR